MEVNRIFVSMAFIMTIWLSGCAGPNGTESSSDCNLDPAKDWDTVSHEVRALWGAFQDEADAQKNPLQSFGVKAMRTAPPQNPGDSERKPVNITSYVAWSDYPLAQRPQLIHDLLCLAEWQIANIPTMTTLPFWTGGNTADRIETQSMEALELEHRRQNGFDQDWCCFILFHGSFFGADFQYLHETRASEHR